MVKLTVKLTDRVTVEGDGENVQEAMMAIGGIIESYRAIGTLGGNPNDYLPQGRSNKDGMRFFTLVEKDEKNELKLGQRQDGSGIFPNKDPQKDGGLVPVWKPGMGGGQGSPQAQPGGASGNW